MNPVASDLNDLYLFAQVIEHHGFTAAGEALGVSKSHISRRITDLEAKLGVRLLHRTSRRLSLTDAGEELYAHCRAMIAEAQAGEEAVRRRTAEPSGLVRASMSVAITDIVLARLLPRFMLRYPKVRLAIEASNRQVDLLEEHVDVVIRGLGFDVELSSLVQAPLGTVRWGLVASPVYLAETGTIGKPDALPRDDLLIYESISRPVSVLRLIDANGDASTQTIQPRLQSDNIAALKEAALAGMGIASLPLYACTREIERGTLNLVLPEFRSREGRLAVLFPTRRGMMPAVRAFVDFLKDELPPLLG
ncbi:LysR substrate-binding domain-containing protein [Paraburkholderia nemoris]|uniref:HTH-type transcriptional regulator DmlR n=1 Tax=Paraburkholderia nemoris TaxID=2793076 RepID=A0ABM8RYF3_9BURK|nr:MULTISPECIES: LysR substrate-binding domain-containing protein [Paraburkholderia]MBK3812268.1 LysR family transcriptional regulator [Paraburkholderia aspalathi]CAE6762388.1 HTH-type transcriptional regulator DmlR [Paraburkholderia nemoris]CAE6778712.1 HTH-type transcriptional regulator DmlR [Paraburkholderia nemoris]